jgi:hypothetical protein
MVCTASVAPSGWTRVCIMVGTKIFLFSKMSRLALGTTQPSLNQYRGFFFTILNQPGHEANHGGLSSADIRVELYLYSPYMLS